MAEDGTAGGFEPVLDAALAAVFTDYAEGFDDFDAARILDCFAFPATIWQMGKGNVFLDAEELGENVEALLAVFEREEIVRSTYRVRSAATAGAAAFVTLDWRQEREGGDAALEFTCHYTLIRQVAGEGEPGDWLIALAVND
ncbi:hypothetical protein [Aurantimonas sp. VKM B-3413]|uniref:hypothetical protein n=1 Tax=Aurantimonas sp. VKM B-3413 TaxID=2779401 RepID=UPI001E55AD27|nr:hypothetical protein [Aurantimonas sp. VKM B-3413]MCB8840573.1 hypothetical protein [Aurantimonas sp. VKM B-3413]